MEKKENEKKKKGIKESKIVFPTKVPMGAQKSPQEHKRGPRGYKFFLSWPPRAWEGPEDPQKKYFQESPKGGQEEPQMAQKGARRPRRKSIKERKKKNMKKIKEDNK
jgi:hypothetical protein